jgi:hypothetical protein
VTEATFLGGTLPGGRAWLLLLRGRPIAAPLLCPLAVTQAAEIDARPVPQFLADPTRLCTGLRALAEALGTA